jgi:hypothetical protein
MGTHRPPVGGAQLGRTALAGRRHQGARAWRGGSDALAAESLLKSFSRRGRSRPCCARRTVARNLLGGSSTSRGRRVGIVAADTTRMSVGPAPAKYSAREGVAVARPADVQAGVLVGRLRLQYADVTGLAVVVGAGARSSRPMTPVLRALSPSAARGAPSGLTASVTAHDRGGRNARPPRGRTRAQPGCYRLAALARGG